MIVALKKLSSRKPPPQDIFPPNSSELVQWCEHTQKGSP